VQVDCVDPWLESDWFQTLTLAYQSWFQNVPFQFNLRRYITDPSPDTRAALEQLLYGSSGPKSQLSVRRVKQLASAFGNYSSLTGSAAEAAGAAGAGALAVAGAGGGAGSTALVAPSGAGAGVSEESGGGSSGKNGGKDGGGLNQGAKEALRLAFAPDGGPVQDILLREMVRYAGAAASELAASVAAAPASALLVGLAEAQQAAAEAMVGAVQVELS
jgi:aarF domain-containing kinase